MAKYVDIEPVIKQLTSVCLTDDAFGMGKQMGINYAMKIIGKARIVEAEPVVHARWEDEYGGKYANPRYRCSACKARALYAFEKNGLDQWFEVQAMTTRCHCCGAHMDEVME